MEPAIKIIGMSSEDTCGCCGKANLKRTAQNFIEAVDSAEASFFGE